MRWRLRARVPFRRRGGLLVVGGQDVEDVADEHLVDAFELAARDPATGEDHLELAFDGGDGVAVWGVGSEVGDVENAAGDPSADGPEFTEAVEQYSSAFMFDVAGGQGITLKGPAHPDNTFPDPAEPYFWTPDNGPAWNDWAVEAVNDDVTLTISDGVAATDVAGIVRAGIRTRGDLTAVLGLGAFDSSGLAVDAAALLGASGTGTLYADEDRGGSDAPLAGELGLGPGETVISRIRWDGSRLRLNDNDNPAPLTLEDYFLAPQRRVYVQTLAGGVASFLAADHTSVSGDMEN